MLHQSKKILHLTFLADAMANPAISRFVSIFMSPADFIVDPTDNEKTRGYLTDPNGPAYSYVNATNAVAANNNSTNRERLAAAKAAFVRESTMIAAASAPAVRQWLDNVFSALAAHLPNVHPAEDRYTDDILYIVTMPEFGECLERQPRGSHKMGCQWYIPSAARAIHSRADSLQVGIVAVQETPHPLHLLVLLPYNGYSKWNTAACSS